MKKIINLINQNLGINLLDLTKLNGIPFSIGLGLGGLLSFSIFTMILASITFLFSKYYPFTETEQEDDSNHGV